jgi:hypothetical protein
MSQVKKHVVKTYPIKQIGTTEFDATIGNPVGLHVDDNNQPYVILEHTVRFTNASTYKVLSIENGKEAELKGYVYVGSFKPKGVMLRHVYITSNEGVIDVPR